MDTLEVIDKVCYVSDLAAVEETMSQLGEDVDDLSGRNTARYARSCIRKVSSIRCFSGANG